MILSQTAENLHIPELSANLNPKLDELLDKLDLKPITTSLNDFALLSGQKLLPGTKGRAYAKSSIPGFHINSYKVE